ERLGHALEEVRDGAQAVRAAAEGGPFDAVLMDLRMPNMSGFDAARAIRAGAEAAGIAPPAMIAITAEAAGDTRAAALASGFDTMLEKPIDPATLRDLLARLKPRNEAA